MRIGFTNGELVNNLPSKKSFPLWAIILIVVGVLGIILALGIFIFIKMRNKRLQAQLQEYNKLGDKSKAPATVVSEAAVTTIAE